MQLPLRQSDAPMYEQAPSQLSSSLQVTLTRLLSGEQQLTSIGELGTLVAWSKNALLKQLVVPWKELM